MEIGGGEDLAKETLLQLHQQTQFVGLRSVAVVLLFLALWGVILYLFRWLQMDISCIYPPKFDTTTSTEPLQSPRVSCSHSRILVLASTLAILLLSTCVLWTGFLGGGVRGAAFFFVIVAFIVVQFPHASTAPFREVTLYTFRIIYQVFLPGDEVHFFEVLIGDILTSLSRVFQEVGSSLVIFIQLYYGLFSPFMSESIPIFFASIPFLLRMRQCWVCFRGAPASALKIIHMLNIIKYCSSLPGLWLPLFLAPYRSEGQVASIVLWYLLFNSLYSFAWDVIMDWGLGRYKGTPYIGLRPTLLFERALPYYMAIGLDLVLRLLWVLKYLGYAKALSYDTFMVVVEVLEVMRRSMWAVFRIEWECLSRGHTGLTPKPAVNDDPDVELSLLEPHFA